MTRQSVSLIGAPTDCGASTTGARMAPDALRVAGVQTRWVGVKAGAMAASGSQPQ